MYQEGQTKRTILDRRVKEHKNVVTSGYPIISVIAEHAMKENHNIGWNFSYKRNEPSKILNGMMNLFGQPF